MTDSFSPDVARCRIRQFDSKDVVGESFDGQSIVIQEYHWQVRSTFHRLFVSVVATSEMNDGVRVDLENKILKNSFVIFCKAFMKMSIKFNRNRQ
jgi:hypothetical protein